MCQYKIFDPGRKKEYHVWDALDLPFMHRHRITKPSLLHLALRSRRALIYRLQNSEDFYFNYFNSLYTPTVDLTADITPSYGGLTSQRLRFIKDGFGKLGVHCKVLLLIRDPVKRDKSAVRYNLDRRDYGEGIEPGTEDFCEALDQYYKSDHARIRSSYDQIISNVDEVFDSTDFYIGVYENMFDPEEVIRLSEFIGVEPDLGYTSVKVNRTKSDTRDCGALEARIRDHYQAVYDFCFDRVPATKMLWG